MDVIIGIDVGNSTTEVAIAEITRTGEPNFLVSGMAETTGIKGTAENVRGVKTAIFAALEKMGRKGIVIQKMFLNNATPVIADFAMDTITETIVTDSTMIGHNPGTPGGHGIGIGYTFDLRSPPGNGKDLIAVIPGSVPFLDAAAELNRLDDAGYRVYGAIVQNDEGTLINNRLKREMPIVDEVEQIEKAPLGMLCAVEVAAPGYGVEALSDPYGIAGIFKLGVEDIGYCRHIAKALIGNRSAVVIRTPEGAISERVIPAGSVGIAGSRFTESVAVDAGADRIMRAVEAVGRVEDVTGEPGTNIGGMIERIKVGMAKQADIKKDEIRISDLFAVDTRTAVRVQGGLAGEHVMESGVGVAAMVHADHMFMDKVAAALGEEFKAPVRASGVEAEMALLGALTTPGTALPLVVVDVGAGSADAALMKEDGSVKSVHLAGAGDLITMLIDAELNIGSFAAAERIKRYPLAHVDSLYRIRYENGEARFLEDACEPRYYGRTVTVPENGPPEVVNCDFSMEKIRVVRQEAKKKVLLGNVFRALEKLDVGKDDCKGVILVGGSFLDFEGSRFVTQALAEKKLSAGKGNIRSVEGPRNAVATGLILRYAELLNGMVKHGNRT
ncbi:MAG: diol dehydratase reactivase subunit alpha [Clostridiales Family XIII bacterium]|jgi:diol dehydratase reactivase alpha subunit|nr:diol dehydratase reactivase subunit alpha [Clostridiales Family XIII bacterium]